MSDEIDHVTVPADLAGERADRVLSILAEIPRAEARRIFDQGQVWIDDASIAPRSRLAEGEVLGFRLIPPMALLAPIPLDLDIRYEDQHVIVVDKPAGLTVHPGAATRGATLASGLLARFPDLEGVGQSDRWGIVHRLDRDTSGLLVVARTDQAHQTLTEAMRRREIHRHYLALVDGLLSTPLGTIDAPIGTDPARPIRRVVKPGGRASRTHYERIDEWPFLDATLLEVTLETGRTHQIRVHLASIGHPVIGDRWYGRPHRVQVPRVFLHAARLRFNHPFTDEAMEVSSPLPDDLAGSLPTR